MRTIKGWMHSITGGAAAMPLLILFGLNAVDELDRTAFAVLLPEIRDEFFQFVEKSAKYSTADELKKAYAEDPNRNLVDLALKIEVVNAKLGPEAGRRAFASGDPQIQKGLTLFGEAARIAGLPKKKRELAVKAGG